MVVGVAGCDYVWFIHAGVSGSKKQFIWSGGFKRKFFSLSLSTVVMTLRQGFPVVSVPLPSKRESCDFTLRPHLQTVGDFISNIKGEDRGVERWVWYV